MHKVPRSVYTLPLWSHHEVGHCYRRWVLMKKPPLCVESHEEATWSPQRAGGLFLHCSCIFSPPWNRKLRSHTLALPGSEERGGVGEGREGWRVHRKTQSGSGLSFFTVISASAALFYLHQLSGCFVVVMWQQLLTVRHLQFWFWKLSRIRQSRFATKSYGAQKKKQRVWWSSQSW